MVKTNQKARNYNYDFFIGIDVDSKSYAYTVMDHYDNKRSKKMPAQSHMLVQYIQKQFNSKQVMCAYEAGPTGYELYDELVANEIACCVVPPNAVPRSGNTMVKNNRLDSERIAKAIESNNIRPIRVPTELYRELRHLIRIYDNYAKAKSTAKNRIKSLLLFESLYKHFTIPERRWTQRFIAEIKNCPASSSARLRLDSLLNDLFYARKGLAQATKAIKQFCKDHGALYEYIEYLMSIPGIGIRTASYILGKLGDPQNLRSPREIGAFFGLTPKENSTGDRVNKGSISQAGNSIARSLLIEASWIAIRYDKQLAQFYQRIKARHAKKYASQKAITAVARKLTARIYAVLKNKKKYVVM